MIRTMAASTLKTEENDSEVSPFPAPSTTRGKGQRPAGIKEEGMGHNNLQMPPFLLHGSWQGFRGCLLTIDSFLHGHQWYLDALQFAVELLIKGEKIIIRDTLALPHHYTHTLLVNIMLPPPKPPPPLRLLYQPPPIKGLVISLLSPC